MGFKHIHAMRERSVHNSVQHISARILSIARDTAIPLSFLLREIAHFGYSNPGRAEVVGHIKVNHFVKVNHFTQT